MSKTFFLAMAALCSLVGPTAANDSSAAKGRTLAKTWCNSCHVIEKGDTSFDDGEIAPPFFSMKTLTASRLTTLLAGGHGDTPALSQLKADEIRQLADWIRAQN